MSKGAGTANWGHRGARVSVTLACLILAARLAAGSTPSGNDFSLDLSQAKKSADRKALLDEALGKQHFFRYLRIVEITPGETGGTPFIDLVTIEPSSSMTVKFKVVKSLSLITLKEAPASSVGDAVAVTGVIQSVDPAKRTMILNPVIVRYKDRLSPKMGGREMTNERDSSGIVYSFTAGKVPVNVSKRDEDLLEFEEKILAERGKAGWSQFLVDEIAKRDEAAKIERAKLGVYRKDTESTPSSTSAVPAQSVITEDED